MELFALLQQHLLFLDRYTVDIVRHDVHIVSLHGQRLVHDRIHNFIWALHPAWIIVKRVARLDRGPASVARKDKPEAKFGDENTALCRHPVVVAVNNHVLVFASHDVRVMNEGANLSLSVRPHPAVAKWTRVVQAIRIDRQDFAGLFECLSC